MEIQNNILINEIEGVKSLLSTKKKILVITHYNPDGDAIGSLMGLYHYLNKKGHDVTALVPNEFPDFLAWIKDTEKIIVYQKQENIGIKSIEDAEVIICADFNNFRRLKNIGPKIESSKAIKLLIDHHPAPDDAYLYKIHDTGSSSTAELVYKFIENSGDHIIVDSTIAECIYMGIMTDTGCFNFNSSKPETFHIVANLLTTGFNKDKVFNLVYNNFSEYRMKYMGYCLNEKMKVLPDLHAAYIVLTKDDMAKYHFNTGDSEGFVNLPFSIKGIHIAALFTEKKDNVRISLRSRGGFAVNTICEKYFEGGGHKNAAGGESKLTLSETIKQFEQILEQYRNEIKNVNWFD
jgi:phosphoesterase RecJ-like protein